MAIAAWLLAMVVIINAYSGVKTSMMAVPHYEPIFNSLEQVVATNGRVRITTETAAVITNHFLVINMECCKDITAYKNGRFYIGN